MPVFKSIDLICLVIVYFRGLSMNFSHMALVAMTWICIMLTAMTSLLAQNSVTGMRIGTVEIDESPGLRLVVETRSPLQAQLSLLTDPYRLVIDMPDASWLFTVQLYEYPSSASAGIWGQSGVGVSV